MAVLDFPSDTSQSPYELNGVTYNWDGQKWVAAGTGGGGGGGGDLTLQEVTDNGNTTNNEIQISDGAQTISLRANGRIGTTNNIVIEPPSGGASNNFMRCSNNGDNKVKLNAEGSLALGGDLSDATWGNNSPNIHLDADGTAEFTGKVLGGSTDSFTPANISAAFVGNASDNNQAIVALGRGTDVSGGARSLGSLWFTDSEGHLGASIDTATTTGWTSTERPTQITFSTTGTSTTPTPRMEIDENGNVTVGDYSTFGTRIKAGNGIGIKADGNAAREVFHVTNTTDSSFPIQFKADGSATYAGDIQIGGNSANGGADGIKIFAGGVTHASRASGQTLWNGFTTGNSTATSKIFAEGGAVFGSGNIELSEDGTIKGVNLTDGSTTKTITEVLEGGGGGTLQETLDAGNHATGQNILLGNTEAEPNIQIREGGQLWTNSTEKTQLMLKRNDASAGPRIHFEHVTATPAAGQVVGEFLFRGSNTDGAALWAGGIRGRCEDPSSSSYKGSFTFATTNGGLHDRWQLNSDGSFEDLSGGGIKFKDATTALTDYEQGTWTPAITSGSATFTNSSQSGQYTKVGHIVTISASVVTQMSAITGANGAVKMDVPFTILGDDNGAPVLRVIGGGSFFGATRGISNNVQVYPTRKGASSFLEMGNAHVNFYPDSTNVTINFTYTYHTDQ